MSGIFPRKNSGKVTLFFRKFPEKFRRKVPEISGLTTLIAYNNDNSQAEPVIRLARSLVEYLYIV